MFCSYLVFYLTIFLLPDLEKRDENQEIEKTKVSGGRMTDSMEPHPSVVYLKSSMNQGFD